ncbi:MAG: pyrimidine dimer DNA glycosylase [Chlorobi bacterium]|nr:pyrimidine dimer DNA glycosylase [Chlorobiota bacterium]
MRIWDLPPALLCRQHLLGEHRELHGLWNVLTQGKTGYRRHPETQRWVGRLAALYSRHEALVGEMLARGYRHKSPLDASLATGLGTQSQLIDSLSDQYKILCSKPCPCPLAQWTANDTRE